MKSSSWFRRGTGAVVLGTALAVVLAGAACGGSGDGKKNKEVEDTIRAGVAKLTANDVDGFLAMYTDNGIKQAFAEVAPDIDRAAVKQELSGQHEEYQLRALRNTKVSDDTATTEAEVSFAKFVRIRQETLVKQDGAWKIDGSRITDAPVASGVKAVPVDLTEFAFGFNTDDAKGGHVAFTAKNVGKQVHELVLVKIPVDANLEELLQQQDPQGIEILGGGDVPAGESKNFVLTEDLAAGRYVMVCFMPDTASDGAPHAMKGMTREFTVE